MSHHVVDMLVLPEHKSEIPEARSEERPPGGRPPSFLLKDLLRQMTPTLTSLMEGDFRAAAAAAAAEDDDLDDDEDDDEEEEEEEAEEERKTTEVLTEESTEESTAPKEVGGDQDDDQERRYPYGGVLRTLALAALLTAAPLVLPLGTTRRRKALRNWAFLFLYTPWLGWVYAELRPAGLVAVVYAGVWLVAHRLRVSYVFLVAPLSWLLVDVVSYERRVVLQRAFSLATLLCMLALVAVGGLLRDVLAAQILVPLGLLIVARLAADRSERLFQLSLSKTKTRTQTQTTTTQTQTTPTTYGETGLNLAVEISFVFAELVLVATSRRMPTFVAILVFCDTFPHALAQRRTRRRRTCAVGVVTDADTPTTKFLSMRMDAHVAQLVGPLLFVACLPLVVLAHGRHAYFLYDQCRGQRTTILITTYLQVAVKLLWTLLLVTWEHHTLRKAGLWAIVKASDRRIFTHVRRTSAAFAFVAITALSSWLLQQNGLRVLKGIGC